MAYTHVAHYMRTGFPGYNGINRGEDLVGDGCQGVPGRLWWTFEEESGRAKHRGGRKQGIKIKARGSCRREICLLPCGLNHSPSLPMHGWC